jgi:hypothetical protein
MAKTAKTSSSISWDPRGLQPPAPPSARGPEKPYVYQEFPRWLYHATKDPVIVNSTDEQERLGTEWATTPDGAKAIRAHLDELVANAAAERAAADRKLSPKARREIRARDQATEKHLPE